MLLKHLTEVLIAWGPAGILLLAILDSAGVPVAGVFDGLLVLVAAERPSAAWICAGLAVVGSTVGNIILFTAARRGGRRFMDKTAPGHRGARFRSWFQRFGMITVLVTAMVPIPMPMKLFVISAGVVRTPFTVFLTVILIGRVVRYFGLAWLGVALGGGSAGFLKAHALAFSAAGVGLFVVLYMFVLLRSRRA